MLSIKALFNISKEGITGIELLPDTSSSPLTFHINNRSVNPALSLQIEGWIDQYLAKKDPSIELPLCFPTLTPFTRKVLTCMATIPYGKTATYSELAHEIGSPKAARAVGGACGRNPFPLVIPCHRIIATNGIGGFSGGIDIKRSLLALEDRNHSGPW